MLGKGVGRAVAVAANFGPLGRSIAGFGEQAVGERCKREQPTGFRSGCTV